MNQPGPVPAPGAGERWSVNMPAVIGVVFVFLVAVIVWVIATGGGGDGDAATDATTTPPTAAPAALVTTTIPGATTTLSPTPLPATTIPPAATTIVSTTPQTSTTVAATTTTAPTTTAAPTTTTETTAAPTTTQPDDDDDDDDGDAASGDLGISGTPMRSPACDDAYITIIASAVGDQATADSVGAVLDGFPGSNYLRTDSTCPSLNPSLNGEPIYVVYFGPFDDDDDACDARSQGTSGSYVRVLSTSLGPDHSVTCG